MAGALVAGLGAGMVYTSYAWSGPPYVFWSCPGEPKPLLAYDGSMVVADAGSLPPVPASDGLSLKAWSVSKEGAQIEFYTANGSQETAVLSIGESATFDGVGVTLCATWTDPRHRISHEDGRGTDYAGRAYLATSLDGTVPVCPLRTH